VVLLNGFAFRLNTALRRMPNPHRLQPSGEDGEKDEHTYYCPDSVQEGGDYSDRQRNEKFQKETLNPLSHAQSSRYDKAEKSDGPREGVYAHQRQIGGDRNWIEGSDEKEETETLSDPVEAVDAQRFEHFHIAEIQRDCVSLQSLQQPVQRLRQYSRMQKHKAEWDKEQCNVDLEEDEGKEEHEQCCQHGQNGTQEHAYQGLSCRDSIAFGKINLSKESPYLSRDIPP